MSQANSLARKRRAGITQNPFPPSNPSSNVSSNQGQNQSQNTNMKQVGLTLQQVVAVIDSRLILLETFMKESKSKFDNPSSNTELMRMPVLSETDEGIADEFVSEVNHRFDFLMNEIADLKDVVMKLQSYTMEVNKSLLEERIHLLSDIDSSPIHETPTITIEPESVKIEESTDSV